MAIVSPQVTSTLPDFVSLGTTN